MSEQSGGHFWNRGGDDEQAGSDQQPEADQARAVEPDGGAPYAGTAAHDPLTDPPQQPAGDLGTDRPPATTGASDSWRDLQMRFVDDPTAAVREAVQLIQREVPGSDGPASPAETERLRVIFTTLRDMHSRLRT